MFSKNFLKQGNRHNNVLTDHVCAVCPHNRTCLCPGKRMTGNIFFQVFYNDYTSFENTKSKDVIF